MTIKLIQKEKTKEIEYLDNIKIKDILLKENIPLETVVIKQNKQIVTEDEHVNDNDEIEIIKVIYGG